MYTILIQNDYFCWCKLFPHAYWLVVYSLKEMQDTLQNVGKQMIALMSRMLLRYSHFLGLPATAQVIMDAVTLVITAITTTKADLRRNMSCQWITPVFPIKTDWLANQWAEVFRLKTEGKLQLNSIKTQGILFRLTQSEIAENYSQLKATHSSRMGHLPKREQYHLHHQVNCCSQRLR